MPLLPRTAYERQLTDAPYPGPFGPVAGGVVLALPYLLLGGAVAYEAGGEYLSRTSFDSATW